MGRGKEELVRIIPYLNNNPKSVELMKVWTKVFQFRLDDDEPFYITVKRGQMMLEDGLYPDPDLIMVGDAKEFAQVAEGYKDITHPIAHGQLRLSKGKNWELISFSRILGTTQYLKRR